VAAEEEDVVVVGGEGHVVVMLMDIRMVVVVVGVCDYYFDSLDLVFSWVGWDRFTGCVKSGEVWGVKLGRDETTGGLGGYGLLIMVVMGSFDCIICSLAALAAGYIKESRRSAESRVWGTQKSRHFPAVMILCQTRLDCSTLVPRRLFVSLGEKENTSSWRSVAVVLLVHDIGPGGVTTPHIPNQAFDVLSTSKSPFRAETESQKLSSS
jgi:hypothetical protein